MSRLGYLGNGLIFFGAALVSCVFLNRWLPYPNVPASGDKIRYLAQHGDENDTIFIGSSRVNFQIQPSVFDRTLAEQKGASKSFNAGLLGMRPPEEGFYLEQVLRQPHRRLRWVFVELISIEARTPSSRRTSARFVSWHDGPRMLLLWTWVRGEWAALREEAPPAQGVGAGERWLSFLEPVSVWLGHVPAFCRRMARLGEGADLCENWRLSATERKKRQKPGTALGELHDGWTPYDARETMTPQMREEYQKTYDARRSTPAVTFHDPASDAAAEAMLEAVTRAGATPIFFVPPMTSERYYYPPPGLAAKMIIWNFSDLDRYPELFAPENRHDYIHLNSAGAKAFSEALAQRFAEFAK